MDDRNIKTLYANTSYSPYDLLYIYYIKGHLNDEAQEFGDDFIGNWQEDEYSFLFFSKSSTWKVKEVIGAHPHLTLLDQYQITYEQWQGGKLRTLKIGGFSITPPWNSQNQKKTELNIVLDPGVVFGSGSHNTTHACLKALEQAGHEHRIQTMIDLGTGTGVLSIAAALLGFKKILAVDMNYLAVQTTLKNIRYNRLENRVLAVQGKAEDFIDEPFDLLVANIHYDVMDQLILNPGFLNKKYFILSGLLRSQARDVRYRLSDLPVEILNNWDKDGIWHTFFGKILKD